MHAMQQRSWDDFVAAPKAEIPVLQQPTNSSQHWRRNTEAFNQDPLAREIT
jgi:hypothetical protein